MKLTQAQQALIANALRTAAEVYSADCAKAYAAGHPRLAFQMGDQANAARDLAVDIDNANYIEIQP